MTTTRTALAISVSFGLFATTLAAQVAQTATRERLTFADVRKQISWERDVPPVAWAPDGVHLVLLDGKLPLWLNLATGKTSKPPAVAAPADGNPPETRKVVRIHEGDLWLDDAPPSAGGRAGRGGRAARGGGRGAARDPGPDAVQLTKDGSAGGKKSEAHMSPDGKLVSFARDNNLMVLDVGSGTEWAVTSDGGSEMFHGVLDWVYQEEIYGRGDFQGHWWSPGSDRLAMLSLDESQVREFTIVNHVPEGFLDRERTVETEVSNYPKVGDPNPAARVSVVHPGSKAITKVDLSAFPKDVLVVRVEWTPDGKTLLLTLQDRIQTWAELCGVDPATGTVTRWIREESATWTNRPESPRWLADGSFLWLSERTGYQHVYHHAAKGELLAAITGGDWQVRSIVRVDETKGVLWFEGTKDGATGRHLYRIGFDGKGLVGLTPGIGSHEFELNADGSMLIDRWSAMDQPTKVCVRSGATGELVKDVGQANRGDGEQKYAFSERKRVTVKARDGYELDACVMLPIDWHEGARYPVYLPTYSGPDAPSVRDSWGHSTYNQFLAQQGFVILQVNVRSASGRGHQHIGTCYQNLGVQELKDLEDAVAHVVSKFGGDPERVAISGWSYGGFMAAFALTHSKAFALGLAGAGVYDWRLYDTIYTERYMRTPADNTAGYDRTSVIKAAKDLHGHLVLLHGSMDDNVHMQNTMQLLWALQSAGKQDVELMIYPRSRHGLNPAVSGHSSEFQWLRLQKLLTATKQGD